MKVLIERLAGVWRTYALNVREEKLARLRVLEHDREVFGRIAQIYSAEAESIEQVSQDESAILRTLKTSGPDAAMEHLNGVLKSYSPRLRAQWSER
jgi:hypothetical protein